MYEVFKNYCRLCAKYDIQNENVFNPEIITPALCQTIEKHFSLKIELNRQAPTTICNECKEFLLKLIDFEEIVFRSQTLFECTEVKENEDTLTKIECLEFEYFDEHKFDTQKELTPSSCNETLNSLKSSKIRKHIKPQPDGEKVCCDICGNKYSTQSSLLSHRKSIHSDIRRFICDECGKTFKRSSDLSRHKEFHRDDDDTPFACSICSKKFKSKLVVAMHEKRHADNRCTCSVCGLELKTKNTLRGHMRMHEELQFQCDYCEKKFRHKKNLSVHLLTHSGLQPYTCVFCNQSFSLRFNLRTHQKKIHPKQTVQYEQEGKSTVITDVVKKKFACGQREAKNSGSE